MHLVLSHSEEQEKRNTDILSNEKELFYTNRQILGFDLKLAYSPDLNACNKHNPGFRCYSKLSLAGLFTNLQSRSHCSSPAGICGLMQPGFLSFSYMLVWPLSCGISI